MVYEKYTLFSLFFHFVQASSEPLADACEHKGFKKLLKLFDLVASQCNLFDVYPKIGNFLDARVLSVDENYAGKGIGSKLIERTNDYARANNIPIISMWCTSRFSARLCEKLNFKRIYAINYADYFVDGQNPLQPAEPHKALQVFAMEVK